MVAAPASAPTVLIVDDDPAILALLGEVLEEEGFSVLTASDGKAALALAHRTPPALVITDLMMPLMDGLELTHHLRSHPETSTVPILLLSAAHQHPPAGVYSAFLPKPFSLHTLLELIDELLQT